MPLKYPFSIDETMLMRRLVTVLMVHAPYIKPKSLFVPLEDMNFFWSELKHHEKVHHPVWISHNVYIQPPEAYTDKKEHLIRVARYLIRQMYEQMDYHEHRILHGLRHLLYKDRLGVYRKSYRESIRFYRTLVEAYKQMPKFVKLGKSDMQQQYDMRKELCNKYGKGFELALEIYVEFSIT